MIAQREPETIESPNTTILVVDDDAIIRNILSEELRDAGLKVVECVSADEAFAVLQSGESFGLLLSDIRMPGTMNGVELASKVRDEYPELKIVLCSSHLPSGSVHFDLFLSKPFKIADMVAAVKGLL